MYLLRSNLLSRYAALTFQILFVISFVSCSSLNTENQKEQGYNELKELVSSRNFEIINTWAYPAGGGNINLIGNPNFIRFQGDSVEVYLPYFGERYSGAGYGGKGGIQFEGIIKNLEVKEQASKEDIILEFEGEQENEKFEFTVWLYPNEVTRTSVNSSQRSVISYRGKISNTEEK